MEEFRRDFLRELRRIQRWRARSEVQQKSEEGAQVHPHIAQPSAGDQLAGASSNDEAQVPHDGLPGHVQDLNVHATDPSCNDGSLQGSEPAHDDDDWLDSSDYEYDDSDDEYDGEYEEDTEDFDPYAPERVAETLGPELMEHYNEMTRFVSELQEGDDTLGQVYQAVLDGRLFALSMEDTPEGLDEPYHGFRGVPASAAAIAGLEKHKYHGSGEDNDCPICFMEYASDDDLSVMPCTYKHKFHQECLAGWLARNHLCPLCRHAMPTEEQDMP